MSDYHRNRRIAVSIEFPEYTGLVPQPVTSINPKVWFGSHSDIIYPTNASVLSARLRENDGVSDFTWDAQFYSGTYSISNLTLKVVDKDGSLSNEIATKLVNNIGTRHAVIRLYEMYAGQPVIDVGPLQTRDDSFDSNVVATYFMENHEFEQGLVTIQCKDIVRQLKETLFEDKDLVMTSNLASTGDFFTAINPDYDDYQEVNTCEFEHNERYSLHPGNAAYNSTCSYMRFRDTGEIVASDSTNYTGSSTQIYLKDRALFNTIPDDIAIDSSITDERNGPQVENIVYLEEYAPELLYMLLTGLNNSGPTPRVLPVNYHLNIDPKWVNEYSFYGDNSNNGTADNLRLRILRDSPITNAKSWIEANILLPMRSVLHTNRFGQIELVKMQATEVGSEQITLDLSNIVNYEISALKHVKDQIYNPIIIEYDKSILDNEYKRVHGYDDATSVLTNHNTDSKRFQIETLYSAINTSSQIDKLRISMQDFYSHEHQELTLSILPSLWHTHIQIGHRVRVKIPKMRNDAQKTGTVAEDLDKVFMVSGVTRSIMNCSLQVRLIATQERATDFSRTQSTFEIPKDKYPVDKKSLDAELQNVGNTMTQTTNAAGDPLYIMNGSATLQGGRYYVLGDLQINGDLFSTCGTEGTGDLEIWACGNLTINGKIDTTGQGCHKPGTAQPAYTPTNYQAIEVFVTNPNILAEGGYFGTPNTVGGTRHSLYDNKVDAIPPVDEVTGEVEEVPILHLSNECGCLRGIPPTVSGTPSSGSRASYELDAPPGGGAISGIGYVGLDGVHGGGGVTLVSRGGAFGLAGKVCTNGADQTSSYFMPGGTEVVNSGGMPGAFIWLTDGGIYDAPFTDADIENNFDAYAGDSLITLDPYTQAHLDYPNRPIAGGIAGGSPYYGPTDHTLNRAIAASRHQYVPQNQKLDESQDTHWLDDEAALNSDGVVYLWSKKDGASYENLVNGLPPVLNPSPRDLYIDCNNQDSGGDQQNITMWRYENATWSVIVGPDSTAAFLLDICRRFGTATIHFGQTRPISYELCDVWFNEDTDKSVKLGATAADDVVVWARQYGDLGEDVLEDGNFLLHDICERTWQTDTNRTGGPAVYPGNFPKYPEQVVTSTLFSNTIGENATPGWQIDATGVNSYRILRPRRPIKVHPGEKYIVESIIYTTGLTTNAVGTQGYAVYPTVFDQNGSLLWAPVPIGTDVNHSESTVNLTASGWFRVHHAITIPETLTDARYMVPNCQVHAVSGNVIISQVHCRRDFEIYHREYFGDYAQSNYGPIGLTVYGPPPVDLEIPAGSKVNFSQHGRLNYSHELGLSIETRLTMWRNGAIAREYTFNQHYNESLTNQSMETTWDFITEEYYDQISYELGCLFNSNFVDIEINDLEYVFNAGEVVQTGTIEAII